MSINIFKRAINPIISYFGKTKLNNEFSDVPIIIGGCPRSGTTLLLSIIGAHKKIYALDKESTAFANWNKDIKSNEFFPKRIDRFYREILMGNISEDAKRWCEKTPKNVLHFGKIINFFNKEVKLIHIIRDGRDVMLSRHPSNPNKYWVSPYEWVKYVKTGLIFKEHPQVLTIKYENLILSYDQVINKICDFIGEKCTTDLKNWFKNTNVKDSKAWDHTVQEIHSSSMEKWKKKENKQRIEEIMSYEIVVDLLQELEYI